MTVMAISSSQNVSKGNLQLGFVGLGMMGASIAARLLEAGYVVHLYDPDTERMRQSVSQGGIARTSPRDIADQADIVFACLPSQDVSLQVAAGPDGVMHGQRATIYVEMSTIGQRTLERIAGHMAVAGKTVIDAPVSGGPRGAEAGTLSIIVSGDPDTVASVRPYLQCIGKNIFDMGPVPGQAQMMKLVNNMISAANMAAACEALVLGAKAGLDPDLMVSVINASTGRNSATTDKIPKAVLPGTFDYGSRLEIIYKDVRLGLEEAASLHVPMWVGSIVGATWEFAMSQGGANEDYSTLIRHMEQWSGVQVRSRDVSTKPKKED